MGHRNIEAILLAQPPVHKMVGGPAAWCLLLMAYRARDDTRQYFGGQTWLALALGHPQNDNGRRVVRKHLAILEKAGYVEPLQDNRGRMRVYQLQLPGP